MNERPPKVRLDRRRIIAEAIDFIDTYGIDHLTMRRLGAALGVEAMALYRYVAGRDRLLDAVVDQVADRFFSDPRMQQEPDSWKDYFRRVAHAIRDVALAHPKLFPLIATRPAEAPWIRPPLRSMRWLEDFLNSLKRYGFTDADAVGAYKAFTSFLLGYLLLEASARGAGPIGTETTGTTTPAADLSDYPHVAALQGLLAQDHAFREFDDALDELIARLRASLD